MVVACMQPVRRAEGGEKAASVRQLTQELYYCQEEKKLLVFEGSFYLEMYKLYYENMPPYEKFIGEFGDYTRHMMVQVRAKKTAKR